MRVLSRLSHLIWRWAARLDVAAVILFVLVALLAIGSAFPQQAPETAADPQRLAAAWVDALRARHGSWADFLLTSGAVRFFSAPLMLIPWAVLLTATLLCTLHRWRGVWRSLLDAPVRCLSDVLAAAPYSATIQLMPAAPAEPPVGRVSLPAVSPGVAPAAMESRPTWDDYADATSRKDVGRVSAPAVSQGTAPEAGVLNVLQPALEARGYAVCVSVEPHPPALYLRADRHRWTRPATLVTHLAVFLLLAGVLLEVQLGWRAELTIPPGATAEVGHGTGLRVANAGLSVERYPDGSVADYAAATRVQDVPARVGLNGPFVQQGVGFYLRGYQPQDNGTALTLLAAYAPGYTLIVLAGFLLLIGMTVTLIFPVCRVQACLSAGGVLRLGGWADRQAYDFGREFADLVAMAKSRSSHGVGGRPC